MLNKRFKLNASFSSTVWINLFTGNLSIFDVIDISDYVGDISLALDPHPPPETPTGIDSLELTAMEDSTLEEDLSLQQGEGPGLSVRTATQPGSVREVPRQPPKSGVGLRDPGGQALYPDSFETEVTVKTPDQGK